MAVGILTIFAGLVALAAAYLYFFGISPEMKRAMEKQALKTMGENKLSYMAKDSIDKIPASDQENIKQVKDGVSSLVGGATKNPLGEQAVRAATQVWDAAQNLSQSVTDRIDWDKVHGYTRGALDRVSTMTSPSREGVSGPDEKTEN